MFDPTAPGGVRALTLAEQRALTDSIRSDARSELKSGPDDAGAGWHSGSPYRPDAEWGDPDYREPASDTEAAARTAPVSEHFPATGWSPRANTELEDALDDPPHDEHQTEPHSGRDEWPHDDSHPDGSRQDWDYEDRVLRDHLADEAAVSGCSRPDGYDGHDGAFTDTQGRWWASTGAWAAGTCDPAKATDTAHPDDPEQLRRRLADLRAELAARDDARPVVEGEQRREQLARWHDDDHTSSRDGVDAYGEAPDEGGGGARGGGETPPPTPATRRRGR